MKKEKIKVDFADFWPYFIKNDNYFYNLLSTQFDVEISNNKPDLLFHSVDYSGKEEYKSIQMAIQKKYFIQEKIRNLILKFLMRHLHLLKIQTILIFGYH